LDPSPAAAFSPFELFYQLIEPKKFTREGATEFWDQFRFELPDNLAEQDEIVLMFCDAALEAVE
jgi:hypothetical protein